MALRQLRYEELQKFREQIKESDDKWQDVSICDVQSFSGKRQIKFHSTLKIWKKEKKKTMEIRQITFFFPIK